MWGEAAVELPLSQDPSLAWGASEANLRGGQKPLNFPKFELNCLMYENNEVFCITTTCPPSWAR